jgi:6-pyruvoyl-tetrahydropterin synthase
MSMSNLAPSEYEIHINRSDMKFNCAHFIAFKGFREMLHGHTYTVSLRLTGNVLKHT